jgi:hypothetical protein
VLGTVVCTADWAEGVEAGCDWGVAGVTTGLGVGLVHAVTLRNPARPRAATAAILFELVAHPRLVVVLPSVLRRRRRLVLRRAALPAVSA